MQRIKIFDLHIAVGFEASLHYAKSVFGNNAVEFEQYNTNIDDAIFMLIADMQASAVFNSLRRDPSLSQYPLPGVNTTQTNVPNQPMFSMQKKPLFELHFEIGDNINGQSVYARTEMINPPRICEIAVANDEASAVTDLVVEMDAQGVLMQLMTAPSMSIFPFGGTASVSSSSSSSSFSSPPGASAKKKDVPKRLPSDIGSDLDHPTCQNVCTSFEHFRDTKCNSICSWRF